MTPRGGGSSRGKASTAASGANVIGSFGPKDQGAVGWVLLGVVLTLILVVWLVVQLFQLVF